MQLVIVEDEQAAVKRLEKMLNRIDATLDVVAVLDSIDDAVAWFSANPEPDLLFLDVQLSDGVSFEIFQTIDLQCSIIFTTAYDEYAIQAFKLNSVDYLLKPVSHKELENAIQKYHKTKTSQMADAKTGGNVEALLDYLKNGEPAYKARFLIKSGDAFHAIASDQILYFYIDNQLVYLSTLSGKRFVVEHSLDQIEKMMDPRRFFRINRQMIVSLQGIKSIRAYFNSRLKLTLHQELDKEIIVSRDKVSAFKSWLDR